MLILDGGEEAVQEARCEIAGGALDLRREQLYLRVLAVLHYSYGLIHRNLSNFGLI